ncbi:MAG TPA: ATP-binding protein, partial [Chloroflexota bacterium]|nr:ATP-binding protein [Chloroflexota bacterium]
VGASLDYHATLANLANLVVPHLADWCAVHLLEGDGSVRQVAVAHADPDKLVWARELQERFPSDPHASTGPPRVLRTGRSELYSEIPDAMLVASARSEEHVALLRQIGFTSALIVPIVARDRVLGAISLISAESGHRFDRDDLLVAEDVGRRAGSAIENAQSYQDAQEAALLAREAEEHVRTLNIELERRVAERTAELEIVNRELESFSYSVAHDLRAPLRGIDGLSQALAEDYLERLDGTALQYLKRIRLGSQRMGALIDDLLSLSRVARREMQRVEIDLSAMAQTIADELRIREPGRDVTFVIASKVNGRGDPHLVRLAFDNLFENAWKFTSKHASARIEFGVERREENTVYFIRDNGAGFDMMHADRLFSAFQRLHQESEFPGTGIGLVTVQRILRRHGGQIWAEGAVEQGAVFYFTLASPQQLEGPLI